MHHKADLLVSLVLALVTGTALAQTPAVAPPDSGTLRVDEFLFPEEGAYESNVALLLPAVQKTAAPDLQGLLGLQYLWKGEKDIAEVHCTESASKGPLFESTYCLALLAFGQGDLDRAEQLARNAQALRPHSAISYLVLANIARARNSRDAVVGAMESGMKAIPEKMAFWEWELARLLADMGDLDGALQCVGVLTRLLAEDPESFTQAGDWLRGLGRLAEAGDMYRTALVRAPWYVKAALGLMEVQRLNGDWETLKNLSDGILSNPDLEGAHERARQMLTLVDHRLYQKGLEVLEAQGSFQFGDLASLDKLAPDAASGYLVRAGQLALRFGHVEDAVTFLSKADEVLPEQGDTLALLGTALKRSGAGLSAREHLERSVQLRPGTDAFIELANMARNEGRFDDCVQLAARALQYHKTSTDALIEQALCYRMLRDKDSEEAALNRAYATSPTDPHVLREVVAFHLHYSPESDKAALSLERLFSQVPEDAFLCVRLADLYLKRGRRGEAADTMGRCIVITPPTQAERRIQLLDRLLNWVSTGMDLKAAGNAVRRVCEAGMKEACNAWKLLSAGPNSRKKLSVASYRVRGKTRGVLETVGGENPTHEVVALSTPGFGDLSTDQKVFLYYMARAAIAGDPLLYLQNHRHATAIRQLMETLFLYREHLPAATAAAVHSYLKAIWLNHGQYDHRTGAKFVPTLLTGPMLLDAMTFLEANEVALPDTPGKTAVEKFRFLEPSIFDPDFEPTLTQRSSEDVVKDSAINLYDPGVTLDMVNAMSEEARRAVAVRFGLVGGQLRAEAYGVDGVGGKSLAQVVHFLQLALPYAAPGPQKESIEAMIRFYQTGSPADLRRHNLRWLATNAGTDYLNGFIESLKDPRGIIGSYEAAASFNADPEQLNRLADDAAYFESIMPWPDAYKRDKVARPVSNLAVLLMGTGDMGPIPWLGYNLPNDDEIRETVGSKNVIYVNLLESNGPETRKRITEAFQLPEHRSDVERYGELANRWIVYLHELIGHGSGRMGDGTTGSAVELLGEFGAALEEARADLVALYALGDGRMIDYGVYSADTRRAFLTAAYANYFGSILASFRRLDSDEIRQPHQMARHMILEFLVEGLTSDALAYGLQWVQQGPDFYLKVIDPDRVRSGLAVLLVQVQVLKSTANSEGVANLMNRYASSVRSDIRQNVIERARRLGLPGQTAFVFPHLIPKIASDGRVEDVSLVMDEDLTAQQLRFSRLQQGLSLD